MDKCLQKIGIKVYEYMLISYYNEVRKESSPMKKDCKHTKINDDNTCIRKVEYQVFSTFQSAYEMVLLCFNRHS